MLYRIISILLAIVFCTLSVEVKASEQNKKIVVLPFSFHNANDDTGDIDIGAEVAKVLSAQIAKMPGWGVVDQSDVWAFLQRDDTADLSGTEIGKALKADAIITGTVQTFEFEPVSEKAAAAAATAVDTAESVAYSASSYVPYGGSIAGLFNRLPSPSGSEKGHAKVLIDAKITDVYSGKVLSALTGTAVSRRSASDLWGSSEASADFLSESFTNCIAGQATSSAIEKICKQLAEVATQVDALTISRPQGTVTDTDNELICLNIGKTNGFKTGDKFIVERASNSDDSNARVGVISITNVGDQSSLAKLVEGKMPVAGDTVRTQPNP
jgi:hypothetical protein